MELRLHPDMVKAYCPPTLADTIAHMYLLLHDAVERLARQRAAATRRAGQPEPPPSGFFDDIGATMRHSGGQANQRGRKPHRSSGRAGGQREPPREQPPSATSLSEGPWSEPCS